MTVESMRGFGALSEHDKDQLRRFETYLRRRFEKRDEPQFHSEAEAFGEVLCDAEKGPKK